jgi:hexosaminidase
MKKNKIGNGVELQAYFNRRVARIINDKKKKVIGWDEILEGGIADNATVMSWRGVKGGIEATQNKHQVVMSPYPVFYLDMMQGDQSIEPPIHNTARLKDVYAFDIIVPGIDSTYVLGGQGNLWTEQVALVPQSDYMTYPRAFAIAEGLWTPKKKKEWSSFVKRTEDHFARFDQAGVNYATSMYDPIINVTKTEEGLLKVELTPEFEGLDLYYSIDNSIPGRYHPKYNGHIVLTEDADMFRVISYRGTEPVGRLISIKTEDLAKRVKK